MHVAPVNGANLEYESHGSGEPVALIHLAPFADSFLPLVGRPELAAYRLVRHHRRGYAGSSKATGPLTIHDHATDLAGLLSHLGIQRAHVVGHSIGALVALQLAVDHPERVGSLTLMEPAASAFQGFLSPPSEEMAQRFSRAFQLHKEGNREGAVEAFYTAISAPGIRLLADQIIPGGWAQTVEDAETFFGLEFPAIRSFKLGPSDTKKITVPVLFMRGALSPPVMRELEGVFRGWFPHMESAVIPDADHVLHMRQPGPVARTLAAFLVKHPLA